MAKVRVSSTKTAKGAKLLTMKFRNTTTTSLTSPSRRRRVAVRLSPRVFMLRPMATARNTLESTAPLLPKAVMMLEGMMFSTTFRGLEPVEPLASARPSMWVLNRPME